MANINRDQLYDMYINQKLTTYQIGHYFGVSNSTISLHLNHHGISVRNIHERYPSFKQNIDKETLYDLYVVKELSARAIGELYDVDPSTVLRVLNQYDIHPRTIQDANAIEGHKRKQKYDIDQIKVLAEQGLCITEIAEYLNHSYVTVYHTVKKYGIETPTTSQRNTTIRSQKAEVRVSTDLLTHLYWEDGLTLQEISETVNLSPSAISMRLARKQVPVRFSSLSRNKDFYEKHPELLKRKRKGFAIHTDIEKKFIRWAISHNIDFITQKRLKAKGHRYDFHILGSNILIETDGDVWHLKEEQAQKDKRFDQEALEHNFIVYRFKGSEIVKSNSACFDILLSRI
jgi:very-short-patch-repair endonuclease/transposase